MPNFIDRVGQVFGYWTVIARDRNHITTSHSIAWLCRCRCGNEKTILGNNLLAGKNTGCGCNHWAQKRPFEALYNELKRNAAKDGREVTLTYEEFVEFAGSSDCGYCGAPIIWAKKHLFKNGNAYNLDRKDNSKGYSKANCVACCGRCNRAKSNHFSYEEWKEIGQLIRTWSK